MSKEAGKEVFLFREQSKAVISSFCKHNYKLKIDKILIDLPSPCLETLTVRFWPFYPVVLIL